MERPLAEVATVARDEFLGAWDNSGREANVFNRCGDDLAHLNHVAEGDYGMRELDRGLLLHLYEEAAAMNRDDIHIKAPAPELDVLVAASINPPHTGGAGDVTDKIVHAHSSKELRRRCPDFSVSRPRGATKRETAELLVEAEPEWAEDVAGLRS